MRPELYTNLTNDQKNYVLNGMIAKEKSTSTAYFCWILSCFFINGIQKFYLGRTMMGLLYILTFGFFYIGTIYDLFTLPGQVRDYNDALEIQLICEAKQIF